MGFLIVRILAAGLGVLMMLGGVVAASSSGGIVSALPSFLIGAALLAGVVLERMRYRSEAAELAGDAPGPGGGEIGPPEPRFRATEERFVDPTTSLTMRVFIDPTTGERRYQAER